MHRTLANLALASILSFVLIACGDKGSPEKEATPPGASRGASTSASTTDAATEWTEKIKIKSADDKRVLEVKWNVAKVKVEIGDEGSPQILKGESRDNGKRKYGLEGGSPICEVKSDATSFKLRSVEGKLLWKVKIDDEKIKISDNEENANPYVLKMKEDKVKIEENDTELGEVKFYPDKIKVKNLAGDELFSSNTTHRSASYGLMLMSRIPPTERAVIIAELLTRSK